MDKTKVVLSKTELDFLRRLLLDLQRNLGSKKAGAEDELVAAVEVALALLQWDGATPPELEQQVGLGAAIQTKLGPDAMCAYQQWRTETRRRPVTLH